MPIFSHCGILIVANISPFLTRRISIVTNISSFLTHTTTTPCQASTAIRYVSPVSHHHRAITNYMKTPLDSRYSSPEMKKLFSARSRYSVWRKLWYLLAQAQKEVGLEGISDEALAQMADHLTVTDEDFGSAAVEEEKRRHDVVSLHAFLGVW